jgi:hypothetical protein
MPLVKVLKYKRDMITHRFCTIFAYIDGIYEEEIKNDIISRGRNMVEKETTVDKRKHKRFKAQKETYIALVNHSIKVGEIINISKGGIAFSYIGKEAQLTGWHKMKIFLSSKRFYLKEVPFKVVSDFCLDSKTPFSTVLMKQCSGQFGELTNQQRSRLDHFIANHTIG